MFNLLPPALKKEATREYQIRMLTVGAYLSTAAILAGCAMLVPPYVMGVMRLSSLTNAGGSAAPTDDIDAEAVIAAVTSDAALLGALAGATPPSAIIRTAVANKTPAITLSTISIDSSSDGTATLMVQGIAKTRADLAAYDRAMRSLPMFAEVTLPISNLARNEDIAFTLTASVVPPSTP